MGDLEVILALSQVILPVTLIGPPLLASMPGTVPNVKVFAAASGFAFAELVVLLVAVESLLLGEGRLGLSILAGAITVVAGVSFYIVARHVLHQILAAGISVYILAENRDGGEKGVGGDKTEVNKE